MFNKIKHSFVEKIYNDDDGVNGLNCDGNDTSHPVIFGKDDCAFAILE